MNEDIVVRVESVEESITMYAREVGNRHMACVRRGRVWHRAFHRLAKWAIKFALAGQVPAAPTSLRRSRLAPAGQGQDKRVQL